MTNDILNRKQGDVLWEMFKSGYGPAWAKVNGEKPDAKWRDFLDRVAVADMGSFGQALTQAMDGQESVPTLEHFEKALEIAQATA